MVIPRFWVLAISLFFIGLLGGYLVAPASDAALGHDTHSDAPSNVSTPLLTPNSSRASEVPVIKNAREVISITTLSLRDQAWRDYLKSLPLEELPAAQADFEDSARPLLENNDPDFMTLYELSTEAFADELLARGPLKALNLLEAESAKGPGIRRIDSPINVYTQVFRKWARAHPQQAADYLQQNKTRLAQSDELIVPQLTVNLAKAWAAEEPENAIAWAQSLENSQKLDAMEGALGILQFNNPELAKDIFKNDPQLSQKGYLASLIGHSLAEVNPEETIAWVTELPSQVAREAMPSVFESWLGQDVKAAQEAFQQLSGPLRDYALPALVNYFSLQEGNYDAAITLLEQEQNGPGKTGALVDLMSNWAYEKPVEAATWLRDQYTDSETFDRASAALARQLTVQDFEVAAIWSNAIKSPELRQERLQESVEAWFEKEPGNAVHWINHSPDLSNEDRVNLAQRFGNFFEIDQQ